MPLQACGKQMKTQHQITTTICQGKTKIDQIDWVQAERLVNELLTVSLPSVKIWYESEKSKL